MRPHLHASTDSEVLDRSLLSVADPKAPPCGRRERPSPFTDLLKGRPSSPATSLRSLPLRIAGDELPARGWEALREAVVTLTDDLQIDIELLMGGGAFRDTFAIHYLPDKYLPSYDLKVLRRFLVCVVVTGWKLFDPAHEHRLSCTAEELALNAIIRRAQEVLDEEGQEPVDFDYLEGVAFEDGDFQVLFDRTSVGGVPAVNAAGPARADPPSRGRMESMAADELAERLRRTLELCEAGCSLHLQKLRRMHPDEGEAQIRARLQEWLRRPEDASVEPPLRVRPGRVTSVEACRPAWRPASMFAGRPPPA